MGAAALRVLVFVLMGLGLSVGVLAATAQAPAAPAYRVALRTEEIVSGLSLPVDVTHAGDDRLFVVEQSGTIRVVTAAGTLLPTPFLDIRSRVEAEDEQGLLGLAFHPHYAQNGRFFVHYTHLRAADNQLVSRISRFNVTGDPNIADGNTELILLEIEQPYTNHNAGDLAFGPDGYLYIPLGDGGSASDPEERAQNGALLLGKLLRIDVDQQDPGLPYAIPPSNPFAGSQTVRNEIWASGLRNPWRISFDRLTGDLYIGDVGQNAREEIDRQPANSSGGENYGWDILEGTLCHEPISGCVPPPNYLPPIYEYAHQESQAVTGGFVYRGSASPALEGLYLFGEFVEGWIRVLAPDGDNWTVVGEYDFARNVASFGEDAAGELYVVSYDGGLHRLHGSPAAQRYLPLLRR